MYHVTSGQATAEYIKYSTPRTDDLYDLYDLFRLQDLDLSSRTYLVCMIYHMFPGLDLYNGDAGQPLTTAGEELDDLLDRDLSDLSDV